jgi:hypothetical protein
MSTGHTVGATESAAIETMLTPILAREIAPDGELTTFGKEVDDLIAACWEYSEDFFVEGKGSGSSPT